ncbi:MAG: hypothetical protein RJA57_507 [Bacteroidota bacterium]|jgi:hypothetical protein
MDGIYGLRIISNNFLFTIGAAFQGLSQTPEQRLSDWAFRHRSDHRRYTGRPAIVVWDRDLLRVQRF